MSVRRTRIVLIDPDSLTRDAIAKGLEEFEVVATNSFDEGYHSISRLKPALVIMDYDMSLQNKLRQLHKDIPVIGIPDSGGNIKPMLDAGALWAQDKFYIQQGLQKDSRAEGTEEIAEEFLSVVRSQVQFSRER